MKLLIMLSPVFRIILLLLLISIGFNFISSAQNLNLVYELDSFNNQKDTILRQKIKISKQQIKENESFLMNNVVYASYAADYLFINNDKVYADKFIRSVQKKGMDKGKLFYHFTFPKYYPLSNKLEKTNYDSAMIRLINIMFETEQNVRTYYRPVINNHKITDPVMMRIDSLNFMLLDSFIYKRGILPADSLISYQVFDKLYLVIFHTVRRLSDQKWAEVKKVLDDNLNTGILSNGYYAAIVDQYYMSKKLPLPYGTFLHDYKEELIEINKNRRKIGLLSYEETYPKEKK